MIHASYSRLLKVAAGAVVAAGSCTLSQSPVSECSRLHVDLSGLSAWLDSHGMDIKRIQFRDTKDMGTGVFISEEANRHGVGARVWRIVQRLRFWGSNTLAKFSAKSVINVKNICEKDDDFGSVIQEALSKHELNESDVLPLFLVLHNSLQHQSPYHAYIQALPLGHDLPLNYTEDMLEELSGTDVYDAVHALKHKVRMSWEQVQPVLHACGKVRTLQPISQQDWRWAHSMVLSRALAAPNSCRSNRETTACLVPGLDFLNHSESANCWWQVKGDMLSRSGCVELRCSVWASQKAGDELCIQYHNDSSNTSLLLCYGIVQGHNKNDCVRVHLPLDSTISEKKRRKQMEVMERMGLVQPKEKDLSFWLPTDGEHCLNPVPKQAYKMLHVMNMSDEELEVCLSTSIDSKPVSLGDELGIMTKFLWLLDQKEASLEGSGQTLEDDIRVLEKGKQTVSPTLWHCVLYRAGHKRIVRGYRKVAKTKLNDIIAALREQRAT